MTLWAIKWSRDRGRPSRDPQRCCEAVHGPLDSLSKGPRAVRSAILATAWHLVITCPGIVS